MKTCLEKVDTSKLPSCVLEVCLGQEDIQGIVFRGERKIPQPEGFVNMIHQEDCINIFHEIIDQNIWGTTLNACSNHHPTRREFYTKAKISLRFEVPDFEETDKPLFKIISSEKLKEILGYEYLHDNLLKSIS